MLSMSWTRRWARPCSAGRQVDITQSDLTLVQEGNRRSTYKDGAYKGMEKMRPGADMRQRRILNTVPSAEEDCRGDGWYIPLRGK